MAVSREILSIMHHKIISINNNMIFTIQKLFYICINTPVRVVYSSIQKFTIITIILNHYDNGFNISIISII